MTLQTASCRRPVADGQLRTASCGRPVADGQSRTASRGRPVADGQSGSVLRIEDKIERYADYFNTEALFYEHIPLLGTVIRFLRKKLAALPLHQNRIRLFLKELLFFAFVFFLIT
jgi:hypothetical protein